MPRFEPFAGLRYNPGVVELADVIAPPYDVVDAERREQLEARSPYNAIHIELPRGTPDAARFAAAERAFTDWVRQGVLVPDEESAFYVYRIGYRDRAGHPRQTAGVLGALELSALGTDVLPHERTMAKPKDERFGVLRSCRANLSPVWVLSFAAGLSALCELPGPPIARATDDEGVHHRLWRIIQPGVIEAISTAVSSAPVLIADGHHRYETALAYRHERRAANGGAPGDYDRILVFAVELADDQLTVRAVHRMVAGLPDDLDLVAALSPWFEPFETAPALDTLPPRMADAGALGLLLPSSAWLLRPRPEAFPQPVDHEPDAALLEAALVGLPPHRLSYQHNAEQVATLVAKGDAQAGILLRPPSVAQIAATARAGRRMPEKTTFFYPKPKTGMVFRPVRD